MTNKPNEDYEGVWLTRKPADELTKIFRDAFDNVVSDGYSSLRWSALMEIFLKDPTNRIPSNGKDRSSARGNLNKAFKDGKMSWKTFKAGIKFLGAIGYRIEVHIHWREMFVTSHGVNVRIKESTFHPFDVKDNATHPDVPYVPFNPKPGMLEKLITNVNDFGKKMLGKKDYPEVIVYSDRQIQDLRDRGYEELANELEIENVLEPVE